MNWGGYIADMCRAREGAPLGKAAVLSRDARGRVSACLPPLAALTRVSSWFHNSLSLSRVCAIHTDACCCGAHVSAVSRSLEISFVQVSPRRFASFRRRRRRWTAARPAQRLNTRVYSSENSAVCGVFGSWVETGVLGSLFGCDGARSGEPAETRRRAPCWNRRSYPNRSLEKRTVVPRRERNANRYCGTGVGWGAPASPGRVSEDLI